MSHSHCKGFDSLLYVKDFFYGKNDNFISIIYLTLIIITDDVNYKGG